MTAVLGCHLLVYDRRGSRGESDAVWDQLPEIKIKDKPRTKRAANMNSLQKPSSDRVR